MKYLITYDIINDKNRTKLSDLLETYGYRVNYSVFEIDINKTKLKKLLNKIEEKGLVDKKYDSMRFYHICENCVPKSFEISNKGDVFEEQELFI